MDEKALCEHLKALIRTPGLSAFEAPVREVVAAGELPAAVTGELVERADARLYRCSAGRTTVHVDPYGNLQPCTISTNGGYNVRSAMTVWNGVTAAIKAPGPPDTARIAGTVAGGPDRCC